MGEGDEGFVEMGGDEVEVVRGSIGIDRDGNIDVR